MKNKYRGLISLLPLILIFSAGAFSQSHIFTYQGKLSDTGTPPTGSYQMEFRLFDAVSGGGQIGALITNSSVSVTEGIFTVSLNFGATAFPGADRFLQISVRRNAGESFVTLNPRQQVASSPYSIRTLSAAQADDSAQLGGVPANQYLQTNGNGSGLTNLNAGSITTGTLSNARLGQIPTANIADSAVTSAKIAGGQLVKGLTVGATTLTDNVTLAPGNNITITPAGNTLTIASTSGGVGGSGTPGTVPLWSGSTTTLANSLISQDNGVVRLPNVVTLEVGAAGTQTSFGSPSGETGITMAGASGRADLRFGGSTVKLVAGPAGVGPPSETNGIVINTMGNVGVGAAPDTSLSKFQITGQNALKITGNEPFMTFSDTARGANTTLRFREGGIDFSPPSGVVMRLTEFSGLGIGTTTPARLLHVNGRARIGSIPSEASVAQVCFNAAGDLLNCSGSSLKWKNNVQSFSDGLNVLRQLRPISYNWKQGGAYDIGLGAEDVAKVAPFFAFRNKEGVVEGVRYERLNMLLINAVNQQQEQIETIRAENDALKLKYAAIEARLAALEEMMRQLSSRQPKQH